MAHILYQIEKYDRYAYSIYADQEMVPRPPTSVDKLPDVTDHVYDEIDQPRKYNWFIIIYSMTITTGISLKHLSIKFLPNCLNYPGPSKHDIYKCTF